MKASLKFREEKRPVLRAKVPLSILGLPFQSGIVAGESKELTLNLSTFFESGPSIKIAYRPNDTWNPFSLIVKTGTGPFGSPISSSMLMSAEFNLLGPGNPSFMLHFKPQFGDFSIKKSQSSVFDRAVKPRSGVVLEDDSSIEAVDTPAVNCGAGGFFAEKRKLAALNWGDITGILSGMEVAAKTAVPVKGKALLKFRWGMRIPSEMKSGVGRFGDPAAGISNSKIPFLVMDKIGIEHVDSVESKQAISTDSKAGSELGSNADLATACYTVKRQLEALQAENGFLKRAVEDLRREISGGQFGDLNFACAVHRYGTESWDSVAMELQKRTSTLRHLFLTPLSCQQKFQELKLRFAENDAGGDDAKTTNNITTAVPWLDELRKLRVAELRREVQQYDLSIVSLQLKVQRLKEEREQSLGDNGKETEKTDLEREEESDKKEEENEPENQIQKPVHAGEESDRENRSVNESNSTDPKDESPEAGPEEAKVEPVPVEPEGGETGKEMESEKPAGEDSCNGSCDSVAKESAGNSERGDPGTEPGDSPESVAESKGEEPNRESSDVQSSASLSGKEKKKAEPDEPDNEELDQSPAIKVSIESQPLVEFLEIFRSHNLGSLFERRLDGQETPDYLNLVRQHLDFETIRTRLEEGWYSGCKSKFFRDLLLLLNNAIVFFGKKSSEYAAAVELRPLVSKEIAVQIPNTNSLPKAQSYTLLESQMPMKPEPEPALSLSMKPKLSVPLIACRKRSSITAKASTSSSGQDKKRQPIATLMNEKPVLDWKQHDKSSEKAEESLVTKKRTRERSASGARKASKNVKTRSNTSTNKNSDANTNTAISSKGGSSNEDSESKAEKEKTNANISSKKRSAANFLNRMRRSSSSNNGPLIETLKGVISSDNGKGDGGEQKKNSNSKGDQRKDQISTPRTRSGGKRAKEMGSPAKRSTGRPPKRAAAPSPATPSVPAKRGREVVENELGSGHAKKRSRK